MNFIGIDPGKSGGIAALWESGGVETFKLADATERDIWLWVLGHINDATPGAWRIAIEKVGPARGRGDNRKQGVSSTFKFGMSYGFLRGIVVASCVPFDDVSPQRWQKELNCLTGGDKNVSKSRAQQLFPQVNITHANADAILLAEYARRTYAVAVTRPA